jgi:arylsulfatase A-like enzyme
MTWAMLAVFSSAASAAMPNVVVVVADDQGWGDLSLHGNTRVRTPNLDGLFQRSRQFRNFMTWCVCSPTRAGLLTGRHPFRLGAGPNVGGELALEETTVAEFFRDSARPIGKRIDTCRTSPTNRGRA